MFSEVNSRNTRLKVSVFLRIHVCNLFLARVTIIQSSWLPIGVKCVNQALYSHKAGICICKIGMSYYGDRFANYPQIVSFLLAPSGFQTVQVFVGNYFSFFSSVQSTWRHLPVPFDFDFHWTHILCRTHWRAPQLDYST